VESTIYHHGVDGELLKDTVIYCTAEKYGLDELKRVALRKQGLRMLSPILLLSCPQTTAMSTTLIMSRIGHSVQHHPRLRPLRLCQHTRHRLQAASSLSRPHHP
jgi:hypothetical protein